MNAALPVAGNVTPAHETAWKRYLKARDKAEESRDIRDGIAAGHAWGAWLELFSPRYKQEG